MAKTTFIAAGDAFITRRLPRGGYPGFSQMQALIQSHDVAFVNLESTFHDKEAIPAAVSGGTWAMSHPRTLDDIREYGFNLFNTANNHSMDFGETGVEATCRHLQERDMCFSGTGVNMTDAARACYLETPGTRVALVSCAATNRPTDVAGYPSRELPGRPGMNPLRYKKLYHVDEKNFRGVQELAKASGINLRQERSVAMGYAKAPEPGFFTFGKEKFVLDDKCWVESVPEKQDLKRITEEIQEAKRQADVVLVSVHSHEFDTADTNIPARFLEIFCRACIDAGASVVIGHGPHELRGIEKYGDGLILYSVGNYIFETENVVCQPSDGFLNMGLDENTKVGAFMDNRSKNGTRGYAVMPEIWNAVLPSWTMEDGRITQLKLYPISLGQNLPRSQKGCPVLSADESWLRYLQELSAPYGTKIEIKDGVGTVDF